MHQDSQGGSGCAKRSQEPTHKVLDTVSKGSLINIVSLGQRQLVAVMT